MNALWKNPEQKSSQRFAQRKISLHKSSIDLSKILFLPCLKEYNACVDHLPFRKSPQLQMDSFWRVKKCQNLHFSQNKGNILSWLFNTIQQSTTFSVMGHLLITEKRKHNISFAITATLSKTVASSQSATPVWSNPVTMWPLPQYWN